MAISDTTRADSRERPGDRPLTGRRVVVTRAQEQAGRLSGLLIAAGATVIDLPVTRYETPVDSSAFDKSLADLASFPWMAFTSANGVRFTCARLRHLGVKTTGSLRIAAVGPATARALADEGLSVAVTPERYDAESLADALRRHEGDQTRWRILLPQADNARPVLADGLRSSGWDVVTVTAYCALPLTPDANLLADGADAVTFASAATVERFVVALGRERIMALLAAHCRFFAIGPQTAAAVRAAGLPLSGVAEDATLDSLVALLCVELGPRC